MAKRIFELAKELGIPSKVILDKCQAEAVPNMNNHMSAVSAGLEATIREWFGGGGGAVTAIETAEHVDVEKVRASTATVARPRARAKPKTAGPGEPPSEPFEPAPAEPAPLQPVVRAPVAPAPPEHVVRTPVATPAAPEAPAAPRQSMPVAPPAPPPMAPLSPVAPVTDRRETAPPPPAPVPAVTPDRGQRAAASAPAAPHAPHAPARAKTPPPPPPPIAVQPVMNVPSRPQVVKPAGPRLETQKPAQLSGPKIVRVEAPERIEAPRPRRAPGADPAMPSRGGPRAGAGAGRARDGGPPTTEDEAARSPRRNKRRGPGAASTPPPARRTARGGDFFAAESSTWREQDLVEREARLSRAGGFLRQRRRDLKKKEGVVGERAVTAADTGGAVRIAGPFTIKDLSAATGVKASEIIKALFMQGIMATVNSPIDAAKAQEIMIEHDIDLRVEAHQTAEEVVQTEFAGREAIDTRSRGPVVTILGHVDHGKTSLLDKIRNTNVAAGEAGGITQATSAFTVPVKVGDETKQIVFLDTPGHEAFTAMRSRGARMTDVVVLVVAADDGVMPQTVESINHAKAANVPIVVALNKIDKPEATESNIQRALGQLAEHGLNPVEWGGDTEVVRTSATTGRGVTELLEALDFRAQLLDLKAGFGGAARGTVIEARVVEGRGPVANVLVQEGELNVGDFIVVGRAYGRVRDLTNDRAVRVKAVQPVAPVQISGLDDLPDAGDKFYVVDSLRKAQEAAEQRRHRDRERELAQPRVTLETMFSQMEAGKAKELRVVIKADVQGSVDVLRKSAEDVSTVDVKVRALHTAVGGITESDVLLADASQAVIIGFNVIPSARARQVAEQKGVQIRTYQVIYDIVDDLKKAAEGLLEPEIRQEVLGHAEVRKVFRVSKVGAVAGCYVTDGTVERNAHVRITRGGIVIEHDRTLEQLKRFKDDAKEVRAGQECGMKIAGYDDIKEGDVIECYRKVTVKRTL